MKHIFCLISTLLLLVLVLGCSSSAKPADVKKPESQTATPEVKQPPIPMQAGSTATIKLATTTSLDNTGLLQAILPIFTKETGIAVDVIAVGTGKALEHGKAGDVDVVLVHDPDAEKAFVAEGWTASRRYICQNEFVIVGAKDDPAKIASSKSASEAFKKIAKSKSSFISRGDKSGTHMAELRIWKSAGITPKGEWYIEAGQGMGATLTMANEKLAYSLTDNGTYYSMLDKLQLAIDYSGDRMLLNIYSVMTLSPQKLPDLKHAEAGKFADWITGPEAAQLITQFQVNSYQLFKIEKPAVDGDVPVANPNSMTDTMDNPK